MPDFTKAPGTPDQLQHRRELVDALRSGKYAQATGTLRRGDSFCCLGVGCDISGLGKWELDYFDTYIYTVGEAAIKGALLTRDGKESPVMEYFGFSDVGDFPGEPVQYRNNGGNFASSTCLTTLNDQALYSFEQIADVIEERFEVAPKA